MLTEWTRDKFRPVFEISLWITVISCAVIGAYNGYKMGGYNGSVGFGFLGLILGTLFGLITIINLGGLISIFLNMDENIEEIRDHLLVESSVDKNVQKIHDHFLGVKPEENSSATKKSASSSLDNF